MTGLYCSRCNATAQLIHVENNLVTAGGQVVASTIPYNVIVALTLLGVALGFFSHPLWFLLVLLGFIVYAYHRREERHTYSGSRRVTSYRCIRCGNTWESTETL